jgi:hypothetical protein
MKRIILVLALVLLIALPVFAQEEAQPTLNWYGAFFTASYFNMLYGGAGTTFNRDYYGFDLDLSYDGLNYGIEMEIEWFWYQGSVGNLYGIVTSETDDDGNPLVSFDGSYFWNYMFVWADFFNGMVSLYAGNQINSVYSPTPLAAYTVFGDGYTTGYGLGQYPTGYIGGKDGFILGVYAVAGLSIALYMGAVDASATAAPFIENSLASLFEVNVAYKIPNIGTVYAGLDPDVADSYTTDSADNAMGFYAAFKFTMVKGLTAQVKYENIADDGNYIYAGAAYKFDFGLFTALDFNLYLPAVGDMSYWMNARVQYGLGDFVFALYFDYKSVATGDPKMCFLPQIVYNFNGGYLRARYYLYLNNYSAAYDGRIRIDYVLYF